MSETKVKCKYFNSGYCKYKEKCRFRHPAEECTIEKCSSKGCMKRHIKLCRYKTDCKHNEICAYKHAKINEPFESTEKIRVLEKTVQELLTFKNKSEAKLDSLEKEVLLLKSKLTGEQHMVSCSVVPKSKQMKRCKRKKIIYNILLL